MKRIDNIFEQVIDRKNLVKAAFSVAKVSSKNKIPKKRTARIFFENFDKNIDAFREAIIAKRYKIGQYRSFKIIEYGKERTIEYFPQFTDNLLQQAILQITDPIWFRVYIKNTYSCIPNRGTMQCALNVRWHLRAYKEDTKICFKSDVHHFYASINHANMKKIIRRKIKDENVLYWLDSYIDSKKGDVGIPIGVNLSRSLSNLYLAYVDHYCKETLKLKHYFRYADDVTILGKSFAELRKVKEIISGKYESLKLEMKKNWQIFSVAVRGVDFVGFVSYHTHTLMRKGIKRALCRKCAILNKIKGITVKQYKQSICGWLGWAIHCNSRHLLKKILKPEVYDTIRFKTC